MINPYPCSLRWELRGRRKGDTMTKEIILLECYKDNHKVAEVDVAEYSIKEIELLLEIQEDMGRTWTYKTANKESEHP